MGVISMFDAYKDSTGGFDFDASHKVIGALIDALQNNFREDTHYKRPLMPPQSNILYALDKDAAESMIVYMSAKMKADDMFKEGEFKFTRKSTSESGGLQRVRLEFTTGVTTEVIRKIIITTDKLAKELANKLQPH